MIVRSKIVSFMLPLILASAAIGQTAVLLAQPASTTPPPAAPPVTAMPPPPIDPMTGMALPLASYEVVVPFKGGCAAIVQLGEAMDFFIQNTRWHGACRFGLAHGSGLLHYEGPHSDGKYSPQNISYGLLLDRHQVSGKILLLPRSSGRTRRELLLFEDRPTRQNNGIENDIFQRSGKSAANILSWWNRSEDALQIEDKVWLVKNHCPSPLFGRFDKKDLTYLSDGTPITPDQSKILVPFCAKSAARLKSEGHIIEFGVSPYSKVDYGYYFFVYKEHVETPRLGNGYDATSTDVRKTVSGVTLCPQVISFEGCEAVWRSLQGEQVGRRDQLRLSISATLDADDKGHVARFAPLEIAARPKRLALARAFAASYVRRPTPAAVVAPTPRAPAVGGKPQSGKGKGK